MARWGLQSRNAEALRCRRNNGLVDIAYSLMMTAITPVNTAYAYKIELISSARGPQTLPDCRSLYASRCANGLQLSLIKT